MSIISGPIMSVSDVKILVGSVYPAKIVQRRDKTTNQIKKFKIPNGQPMQLTIYSNQIVKNLLREQCCMIIPFPQMARTRRFKILNISNYDEIFRDFNTFFKENKPLKTDGIKWDTWDDDEDITDINKNEYEPKVVSNFIELFRNKEKLHISNQTLSYVKQFYSENFSFIVCPITITSSFKPLAFIHELMPDGKLFVPTRHFTGQQKIMSQYHADEVDRYESEPDNYIQTDDGLSQYVKHEMLSSDKYLKHKISKATIYSQIDSKNNWDHTIFVVNAIDIENNSIFSQKNISIENGKQNMIDHYKKFIKIGNIPSEITFNGIHTLHRITVYDNYKLNHDLML